MCKDKFHAYKFVELEQKCVKKYGSGEGGDDAAAGRGADKSHDENRTSDDGILDQRKSDDVPADREGTPELVRAPLRWWIPHQMDTSLAPLGIQMGSDEEEIGEWSKAYDDENGIHWEEWNDEKFGPDRVE